jgi:L-alanine-DL-glutamate epimerase-like enolase superfamily enzyme
MLLGLHPARSLTVWNGFGWERDNTLDTQAYKRGVVEMFRLARKRFGDEIELLHDMHERVEPMAKRWYDFIRIHISQIGGITPAMKVARLGEWFNVRTICRPGFMPWSTRCIPGSPVAPWVSLLAPEV